MNVAAPEVNVPVVVLPVTFAEPLCVRPVIVAVAADTLSVTIRSSPTVTSSATVRSFPAPATVKAPVCVVPSVEVPAFNVPVVVLPDTSAFPFTSSERPTPAFAMVTVDAAPELLNVA